MRADLNRPIPAAPSIPHVTQMANAGQFIERGSVVCIGNFDGVHLGHQETLRGGHAYADRHSLPLWVLSFNPHPRSVLDPGRAPLLLTEPEERVALLAHYGVDGVVMQEFDQEFARIAAGDFLEMVSRSLSAREIVVGVNFRFGHGREGGKESIERVAKSIEAGITFVDLLGDSAGNTISSGEVRKALSDSEFELAVTMLGHPYPVTGKVVAGFGKGRDLGYPTWNLALSQVKLPPPVGVYAGWASRPTPLPGMAYYGSNPMFGGDKPHLEVNILSGSSEEKTPRHPTECFWLSDFIRPEMIFKSADELKRQLADDEVQARRRLNL